LKAGQGIQAKLNKGVVLSSKSRNSFEMPLVLKRKMLFGTGVALHVAVAYSFFILISFYYLHI